MKTMKKITLLSSLFINSFFILGIHSEEQKVTFPEYLAFTPESQNPPTDFFNEKRQIQVREMPIQPVTQNRTISTFAPGLLFQDSKIGSVFQASYEGIGTKEYSSNSTTRSFNMQIQRDGIPLGGWIFHKRLLAVPSLTTIDHVDFYSGPQSTYMGPSGGAVLNFVSPNPVTDKPFEMTSSQTLGSYGLYSTTTTLEGIEGKTGYISNFYHSQWNGPASNQDYNIYNGDLKLIHSFDESSKITFGYYGYEGDQGYSGGLSRTQYDNNRDNSTTNYREFLKNHIFSLEHEIQLSNDTHLIVKEWVGLENTITQSPLTATLTALTEDSGVSGSMDARLIHQYELFGEKSKFLVGFTYYNLDMTRESSSTTRLSKNDTRGTFEVNQDGMYGALFAANTFNIQNFSITPSFRMEYVNIQIDEEFNINRTSGRSLLHRDWNEVRPLFGLDVKYQILPKLQWFSGISQNSTPPNFLQIGNPTTTSTQNYFSPDVESTETWYYQSGFKADLPMSQHEVKVFYVDTDDIIGEMTVSGGGTQARNLERNRQYGAEYSQELRLMQFLESGMNHVPIRLIESKETWGDKYGRINLFSSVNWLQSEFKGGPNNGRETSASPTWMFKNGLVYRKDKSLKVALMGNWVEESFSSDTNSPLNGTRTAPTYLVWDLTAEYWFYKNHMGIHGGILNLFDEDYYSRVSGAGIEASLRRNFYVGVSLKF